MVTQEAGLAPGRQLAGHRLIRRLGRGAFGEAWLASSPDRWDEVCVKVALDPLYRQLLRREARALERLEHPGVAALLGVHVDHEPPFVVQVYVPGRSLRAAQEADGPMAPERALALLRQLVDALDHGHRRGVIHRDIKPENLMLRPDGSLCLLDFGVGHVALAVASSLRLSLSLQTSRGASIAGTLQYMSPGQLAGQPPSPAADYYAAGIVLFEMVTGRLPGLVEQLGDHLPPGRVGACLSQLYGLLISGGATAATIEAALARAEAGEDAAGSGAASGIASGIASGMAWYLPRGVRGELAVDVLCDRCRATLRGSLPGQPCACGRDGDAALASSRLAFRHPDTLRRWALGGFLLLLAWVPTAGPPGGAMLGWATMSAAGALLLAAGGPAVAAWPLIALIWALVWAAWVRAHLVMAVLGVLHVAWVARRLGRLGVAPRVGRLEVVAIAGAVGLALGDVALHGTPSPAVTLVLGGAGAALLHRVGYLWRAYRESQVLWADVEFVRARPAVDEEPASAALELLDWPVRAVLGGLVGLGLIGAAGAALVAARLDAWPHGLGLGCAGVVGWLMVLRARTARPRGVAS